MDKGNVKVDPRGLIFESYRMEGISIEECRAIFLDWALGFRGADTKAALTDLHDAYVMDNPEHPMSRLIKEGLATALAPKGRRGGRGRKLQ